MSGREALCHLSYLPFLLIQCLSSYKKCGLGFISLKVFVLIHFMYADDPNIVVNFAVPYAETSLRIV